MFKNKALQVKMVETPEQEQCSSKPRFDAEEIRAVKEITKIVGTFVLVKVVIDTALKVYLKS